MNFSFSEVANTNFTSDAKKYLKPYGIYKVKLTKFEKTELKGSKDPTATYPIIALEFEGEDGLFSENIFIPVRDEDFERNENQNSHKLMPSRFDRFLYTLMQITEVTCPKNFEKVKELTSKINIPDKAKAVDAFIQIVSGAINKEGKTSEVYLKLIGRNANGSVYATLPNSCLIGDNGKPATLNFISSDESKLYFSPYEIGKMKEYQSAKPTKMPDNPDTNSDNDTLDLDGITFD
jgi:hypothetical protein